MMMPREIDALVAEKVMGGIPGPCPLHHDCISFRFPGKQWNGHAPKYSTDIATAWPVVECLKQKGFAVKVEDGLHGSKSVLCQVWSATNKGDNWHRPAADVWGDTVAMAICIAALKTVGNGQVWYEDFGKALA